MPFVVCSLNNRKLRRCDEISILSLNIIYYEIILNVSITNVFTYICILSGFEFIFFFLFHSRIFALAKYTSAHTVRDSTRKYFPIEHLHQRQIYVCVSAIFRKRYIAVTTAVTWRNSPRNTFQVEILESRVIITKPYARSMAQHKSIYANKSSAAQFEHLSHCCTLAFHSRVSIT